MCWCLSVIEVQPSLNSVSNYHPIKKQMPIRWCKKFFFFRIIMFHLTKLQIPQSIEWWMFNNCKGRWRNRLSLIYVLKLADERHEKYLTHYSQSLNRDLNTRPPEYKTGVLTIQLSLSIKWNFVNFTLPTSNVFWKILTKYIQLM